MHSDEKIWHRMVGFYMALKGESNARMSFTESTTLMPSDAAQSFIASGSTATTATRLEFRLSPKNKFKQLT